MPNVARNPFPGVNPYVEAESFWEDFHGKFVAYLCEQLTDLLPSGYDVRLVERVNTRKAQGDPFISRPRQRRSDVAIIESPSRTKLLTSTTAGSAVAEPVELEMIEIDEERQRWLAVRRERDDELVTSIELLSPTNKAEDGFADFARERRELLASGVNLVDLDLLRAGHRLVFNTPLPAGDYFAFVTTAARRWIAQCYPWTLRSRLPVIPIPLADGDPDVLLDLNVAYGDTFSRGGYPGRLHYTRPLPGVDAATAAWARSLVDAAAAVA